MTKAREANTDLFLALLDFRNVPSEQLGALPAQLMFGRRTRTRLPTASTLLSSPSAAEAKQALNKAKQRQASYYNHGAKQRATLPLDQTVRVRYDRKDWRKAKVTRVLLHWSYKVTFDDGTTRRRTSCHVGISSEPPIIFDDNDLESSPPPSTADVPPPAATTLPVPLSHVHPLWTNRQTSRKIQ